MIAPVRVRSDSHEWTRLVLCVSGGEPGWLPTRARHALPLRDDGASGFQDPTSAHIAEPRCGSERRAMVDRCRRISVGSVYASCRPYCRAWTLLGCHILKSRRSTRGLRPGRSPRSNVLVTRAGLLGRRGCRRLSSGRFRECLLHAGLGFSRGVGRRHVVDQHLLQHVRQDQGLVDRAQLRQQQR